jgi:cobalt/nickel transport protein
MTLESGAAVQNPPFFDRFTKIMVIVMLALLLFIFASAKIMTHDHSTGTGTDDRVNALGSTAAGKTAHPFIELPGDTQVAAFSIANFFVGIILGYSVQKLFVKKEGMDPGPFGGGEGMEPEGGAAG